MDCFYASFLTAMQLLNSISCDQKLHHIQKNNPLFTKQNRTFIMKPFDPNQPGKGWSCDIKKNNQELVRLVTQEKGSPI